MKKLSIIFLLLIPFILVAFFPKTQVKSKTFCFVLKRLLLRNVPEVSIADISSMPHRYIFLDTREYEEYSISHLPGAIFVGYKDFKDDVVKEIPKDKLIVAYCSVGKRSENISQRLIQQGYSNVQNLYGGIFERVNQGYPVYDNQNKQTHKVHAYSRLWGRFLDKGEKVY